MVALVDEAIDEAGFRRGRAQRPEDLAGATFVFGFDQAAVEQLHQGIVVARLMEGVSYPLYRVAWWLAASWIGFAFILFFCMLGGHLVEAIVKRAGEWPGDGAKLYSVGIPVVLGMLLGIVGLVQGLSEPTLARIDVAVEGLPEAADGLTIVQISDTHIGAIRGVGWTRALVDRVNALEPDIVAVTGDLVDENAGSLMRFEETLSLLKAKRGVYAVTGNHEYIHGAQQAIELMKRARMRVLGNEVVEPVPGLRVVGLHDQVGGAFRVEGHGIGDDDLAQLVRSDAATILLYHQPVRVERFAELGVDLMLCGHTHEGQIWPFGLIQKIIYPRNVGRYEVNGMTLYVSSGTGTWGSPMRLGTRSEFVLVTLRRR